MGDAGSTGVSQGAVRRVGQAPQFHALHGTGTSTACLSPAVKSVSKARVSRYSPVEFRVAVQVILNDLIALAGFSLKSPHVRDMDHSPAVFDQPSRFSMAAA